MVATARDKLLSSIAEIERGSMGLNVLPPIRTWVRVHVLLPILTWLGVRDPAAANRMTNPWRAGLAVVVAYIVIFIGLPYLVYSILVYCRPHDLKLNFNHGLYALQLYGALWAGWATVSTNIVVRSLCRTIRTEIAPRLQDQTSKAITRWIRANFARRAVLCRCWAVGVLCSIIAGVLIFGDLPNLTRAEVTFWSLGWCLLFATSTGVVIVGRFYSAFAAHLDQEVASLYPIDPTQSSLLRSVDSLGQRMLLFWFLIAVSIALIYVPKTLLVLELSSSRFIIVEVALAGFFSIGVGTWVFLGTQVAIRHAAWSATDPVLRVIEAKTAAKLAGQTELPDEEGWKELARLEEWHTKIASSLSVRSRILSVLSLVLPFIPLVSAILAYAFGIRPAAG
jgi:hypothetical protein